jgi:hypothetical protein
VALGDSKVKAVPAKVSKIMHAYLGYGARVGGSKYYAVNLILRLFLYQFYIQQAQVYPQQHKQPTNTTTMVMEPLAPPAAWI